MDPPATQLADTRPQVDTPLRVAIPVNVPERQLKLKKDQFIYLNVYSPAAFASARKHKEAILSDNYENLVKKIKAPGIVPVNMEHDALLKNSIKDFSVLAISSKRAEKKDVEATAYASLGVINDNQGLYLPAIENYKSYLAICEDIEDIAGIACASNCIGVNYLLLTVPQSDAGSTQSSSSLSPESKEYLNKAIYFHMKHLEVGPDAGGHFVAHTNLGLCHAIMGDLSAAAKHHQDALRIAIKMQTLYGQSIAVGNLGLLAMMKNDYSTAKTCFDQHLQLVQALQDPEAEIQAWKLVYFY